MKAPQKKIQDEIRRRVLEKDQELLQKKNEAEWQNVNLDVLADMTALSRAEVDSIANEVQQEWSHRRKRTRVLRVLVTLGMVIILLVILFNTLLAPEPFSFTETFDTNEARWDEFRGYTKRTLIEEGAFIFENGTENWNYWSYQPVDLPQSYRVELASRWLRGKFAPYGIILLQDNENYTVFQVNGDGDGSYLIVRGGEYVTNPDWTDRVTKPAQEETPLIQRVDVQNQEYTYYIDDTYFHKGTLDSLHIQKVGMFVGELQTVAFDQITIWELENGEPGSVIWEDSFEDNTKEWLISSKYERHGWIEKGAYVFEGNTSDTCYWAATTSQLPTAFEMWVESTWKRGELSWYGFQIFGNETDYYAMELRNDGQARLLKSVAGEYVYYGTTVNTSAVSLGDRTVTQSISIESDQLIYYVGDQMVDTVPFEFSTITQIALRVCGQQTIHFEALSIQEK
jgi:hypothetical protein